MELGGFNSLSQKWWGPELAEEDGLDISLIIWNAWCLNKFQEGKEEGGSE